MISISFRPLVEPDLDLLLGWFRQPHVGEWWPTPSSEAEVFEEYLPKIRGEKDARMLAILADGYPIGMIQHWSPDPAELCGAFDCGIDLLIGDPSMIGRGLGSSVIDAFVVGEVFGRLGLSSCVADPHESNARSIRAFEKEGFQRHGAFRANGQKFLILVRLQAAQ
jgi:RimJ/RimL family protein N-acetyltransferase